MLSIEKPNSLMFTKNGFFRKFLKGTQVIFKFYLSGQKFPATVVTL